MFNYISRAAGLMAQIANGSNDLANEKISPADMGICIATHCPVITVKCMLDSACFDTFLCIAECDQTKPGCDLNCEVKETRDISLFTEFTECIFDNKCRDQMPDDGKCRVKDADGQKNLTTVDDIAGDWWVIRGLNPHYDSFPCQHNRYRKDENGIWTNNVTWIDTFHGHQVIGAVPVVNMSSPGVYNHYYDNLSQVEPWIVISMPHPDYLLMLWCGYNPVLKYAGGILMSRDNNYDHIPKDIEDIFRQAVAEHGIDLDNDMFVNDNSQCALD
jgi:hypothetical protein